MQVDPAQLQFTGGCQFQQLFYNPVDPAHFLDHNPGIFPQFASRGEFLFQQLGGAFDPAERVLDFMGQSRRYGPERGEPINLTDRPFKIPDVG